MAAVTLDRLWIHDGDDLSTYLRFYTTDRDDRRSVPGEVRRYASGRLRTVVRTGTSQTLPVTLRLVTDPELAVLESWLGRVVLVRDHRGRFMFASYFDMAVDDYEDRSGYDVKVTFGQVTRSVEV